ncbi:prepilin-type N-terminal cleavage/methylation domain-containing protein [Pseudomonas sp. MAP12]|uniref:Prepilin-type N-terminal cleavage/methylation domain-containing protein n=1 Tax=Geopseudomonas aromaticivorans TaxID=2849492 RepID=A0ABS6MTL9_9GAMM|nr:prepilin-type N-terminal cleavage/methylation domain-containing protein [Pseudomonas aromaticivorans]MBV2131597.1 prepilin-type N-terminal cleavage/methylation domain-containing protein [Pseudomonas aromaticivorans]
MRSTERGFTLLEVLVAFLILSLSMGVLMRIVSQSIRALDTAEQHQIALQLAESKLVEVLAQLRWDSRGKEDGRIGGRYRWTSKVERYQFPNQLAGESYSVTPWLVQVTVSWGRQPNEQLSLSTVRLMQAQK